MEIKPNLTPQALSAPLPTTGSAAGKKAFMSGDTAAFGEANSLDTQLTGEPSVRHEAIQRAQNLIAQTSWPSSAVMAKVSSLLADHLGEVSL